MTLEIRPVADVNELTSEKSAQLREWFVSCFGCLCGIGHVENRTEGFLKSILKREFKGAKG